MKDDRRKRAQTLTIDRVPSELSDLLGKASSVKMVADGATASIWTIDPGGDGILLARSAARDAAGVVGQVVALRAACVALGMRPRLVIASTGMSGTRRFHERPDLLAVDATITEQPGWCRFLGCQDRVRISRDTAGLDLFGELLLEQDVELRLLSERFEAQRPVRVLAGLVSQPADGEREAVARWLKGGGVRPAGARLAAAVGRRATARDPAHPRLRGGCAAAPVERSRTLRAGEAARIDQRE